MRTNPSGRSCRRAPRPLATIAAVAFAANALLGISSSANAQEAVNPSTADPHIRSDDDPNLVYGDDAQHRGAPLAIFLPGGKSAHAPSLLLDAIASQGYRVIDLSYDDDLAGDRLCFRAAPWAERHVRENTTGLIANAYAALGIPADHILLFDSSEPANATGENPYHGSTIRLPQYRPQWLTMYGSPLSTADQ